MSTDSQRLTEAVLALPEWERKGLFLRLAESLPDETAQIAESSRRATEMRMGIVKPLDEQEFSDNLKQLRERLHASGQ